MTTPRPHDQPVTTDTAPVDGAMETFELRMPRGPLGRLFDGNRLIRRSDRIEAAVLALVLAISLVAAPFAAAMGTAVYDSHRQAIVQQAANRHIVTATVTDGHAAPEMQPAPRIGVVPSETKQVEARWSAAGVDHSGTVPAPSTAKTGDSIDIWVDQSGEHVGAPPSGSRAAVDGATTAVAIWLGISAAAATLFAVTRAACNRIRLARWDHDIDRLSQAS